MKTENNRQTAAELYSLGKASRDRRDIPGAERLWKQAIDKDPDVAQYHASLANLYTKDRRYDDAVRPWKKACQLAPHRAEFANGLGAVLFEKRQTGEALTYFEMAHRIAPETKLYQDNVILCKNAQADDLALTLGRLAGPSEIRPSTAIGSAIGGQATPANLGQKFYDEGQALEALTPPDYRGAIDRYKSASYAAPLVSKFQYKIASVYHIKLSQPSCALEFYRKASALEPSNAMWHNGHGMCLNDLGDLEQALRSLSEAARLNPQSPLYRENLRSVSARQKRQAPPPEIGGSASSARSTGFSASSGHDELLRLRGEWEADPHSPEKSVALARCYASLGLWKDAAELYAYARHYAPRKAEYCRELVDCLKNLNVPGRNFADGDRLFDLAQPFEALPHLMAANEASPGYARWQNVLGIAHLDLQQEQQGLDCFMAAWDLDQNKLYANNICVALVKLNRSEEAKPWRLLAEGHVGLGRTSVNNTPQNVGRWPPDRPLSSTNDSGRQAAPSRPQLSGPEGPRQPAGSTPPPHQANATREPPQPAAPQSLPAPRARPAPRQGPESNTGASNSAAPALPAPPRSRPNTTRDVGWPKAR